MQPVHLSCKQCDSTWQAPSQGAPWWRDLASNRRGFLPEYEALKWSTAHSDFDEWTIKTIIGHLACKDGRCHNCQHFLLDKGFVECLKCSALNLAL